MYFENNSNVLQFSVADVTSIDFETDNSNNIYIDYQGSTAMVTNPLAGNGVEVTVNGAFVEVNATTLDKDVNYILSGTSTNGQLKVYSEYRYNVILNNLNLTNPTGPALNSQSEKKVTVHLLSGSTNVITDGANYTVNAEDQKGTFFAEGKIDIIGGGTLTVNGLGVDQHAIASDEDLEILEGSVVITSAAKDGVHTSEGFFMNGGSISVTSTGDGIDGGEGNIELNCGDITIHSTTADVKGMACDSTFEMNGGNLNITVTGNQSKAIKGGSNMYFNGGTVTASTSGAAVLIPTGSGNDPSYSKLISCDSSIYFGGTNLNLTNSGIGSRAISADGDVEITEGIINVTGSGNGTTYTNSSAVLDAYHGVGLRVNGNLKINGGTTTLSHSGKGGKGIDAEGSLTIGNGTNTPALNITTTGAAITITSGGGGGGPGGSTGTSDKSRAVKAEEAVVINSGVININSANDGIKSVTSVTINGGELTISNSTEGIESPFITVNNGDISITASDDGFNATHGTTAGGTESNDGSLLKITGGYCYVSTTGGDAVDSNGGLQITGGTLVVHGPTSSPELGLDYNGTGTISGGLAVVSGPGQQMLQGFGTSSTQKSFILKTSTSISANTLFHVEDANGVELFTFKPVRNYMTIVFSSPAIVNGTYKIYTSGSHTGTNTDGLYSGGAYTAGTLKSTFTVSNAVTTVSF